MRYEKPETLLQLSLDMQATRAGLSLGDIEEKYNVSRRTAHRMRDAVLRLFPQAEEVPTGERIKRWRIPSGVLNRLVRFDADELADIELAAKQLKAEGHNDRAKSLENVARKLRALMKPDEIRRAEPDIDAALEAEGLAMRPGPRPRVDVSIPAELRKAVKTFFHVTFDYYKRGTGQTTRRTVAPLGFLHGHRHYLVATVPDDPQNPRLFCLSNIDNVALTGQSFSRPDGFALEDFAKRSFGVYQQDPFDVHWEFSPRAAPFAKEFVFHPNQSMTENENGGLTVKFTAGGLQEMCWHLYQWGTDVDVISPPELAQMVAQHRRHWQGLP